MLLDIEKIWKTRQKKTFLNLEWLVNTDPELITYNLVLQRLVKTPFSGASLMLEYTKYVVQFSNQLTICCLYKLYE